MSASISTASYIHHREKSTPPPPSSPWEQRGRRPFAHFTLSGTKSAATNRRNRTIGRVLICLILAVVVGMALGVGEWVCEGETCTTASTFLSQSRLPDESGGWVGGGSVLGPLHSQADPSAQDTTVSSEVAQHGDVSVQSPERGQEILEEPQETYVSSAVNDAWETSVEEGNEPELVDGGVGEGDAEPEHVHGESGNGVAVLVGEGNAGEVVVGGVESGEGAGMGTMEW